MDHDDISLLTSLDVPTAPSDPPLRPTVEYEDITLRELSLGFAGGTQDMTLYPEDVMESDGAGNIRVTFHTMGDSEFVAYAGHTQWHSLRDVQGKRVKGTLRPNPEQMMQEYRKRQEEERLRKNLAFLANREGD